ncbi:MAG: hypothetical protein V2A74_14615 [bacterium]
MTQQKPARDPKHIYGIYAAWKKASGFDKPMEALIAAAWQDGVLRSQTIEISEEWKELLKPFSGPTEAKEELTRLVSLTFLRARSVLLSVPEFVSNMVPYVIEFFDQRQKTENLEQLADDHDVSLAAVYVGVVAMLEDGAIRSNLIKAEGISQNEPWLKRLRLCDQNIVTDLTEITSGAISP